MYTERLIPTCIEGEEIPHLYEARSDMYTGTSICGLKQSSQAGLKNVETTDRPSEMATEACRQSWVLVRAIK